MLTLLLLSKQYVIPAPHKIITSAAKHWVEQPVHHLPYQSFLPLDDFEQKFYPKGVHLFPGYLHQKIVPGKKGRSI
jgi:hypothetical protein